MDARAKSDIDTITAEITAMMPDARVILFGSYAKNEAREGSDIDICVVGPYVGRKIDVMHALRHEIYKKVTHPMDILVYSPDEFERNSTNRSRIEYSIANEGVILNVPS
jgi:predicted nucleotidyltransferase